MFPFTFIFVNVLDSVKCCSALTLTRVIAKVNTLYIPDIQHSYTHYTILIYILHNTHVQATQYSTNYTMIICPLQNTYMQTTKYLYTHCTILIHTLHNTHSPTTQYSYTHYTTLLYTLHNIHICTCYRVSHS